MALPRLYNISVIHDFRGAYNTNPQSLLNHMGWELDMQKSRPGPDLQN